MQALIVAATSEDWDSRFIIPFLPVFMVLGAAGVTLYLKKKVDHER
ncbi:hypothetical protein [Pontibacter vulgaris]|nr:hypothetical protein [Pontibacter vulgaris]